MGWAALVVVALTLIARAAPAADPARPWALQKPLRPPLPTVKDRAWVRNTIDAFILAKLDENGLTPAPEADRITLIRRVTFDLTGLPPTPQEVDAFVHDAAPDAYDRLVDRLLASPQHGERWALFWLDLVRFAESDGFKADDPRPFAWRYRDYVIRSFNEDKPYDRFVREQLAGDELYPDDANALIATGFNRHFPDEYNAVNLEQRRQEILNDMTDTTAQVFLGLTLGCARCHDHKFDPISQEDYYRIQAFFAAYQPADLPAGKHEEMEHYRQQLREWEEKTAELRQRMAALEEPYRKQFAAKRRARFPKEYGDLLDIPPEQRDPLQTQIAAMVQKQVQETEDEVVKAMKPEVKKQWQDLGKEMAEFAHFKPPAPPTALTLTDIGPTAPATYLLKRGDWRHRDKVIAPGFLSAIDDRTAPLPSPGSDAKTTGRRTVLANWLTQPDQPLTARVMMNRLWQQHFGRGIVATPGDFGVQGESPTHPELLDWLAREFVDGGWSLKTMDRLLVTSATYRQANRSDATANRLDPENRLLWRANRRRLDGEALRDALLSVSGSLNPRAGGPSVFPDLPPELGAAKAAWPVSSESAERNRRSVYVFVKRNLRYPLFSTFDAPDRNETCSRRYATTTAPQALMLLNSKLVFDQARIFAGRVLREAGPQPEQVIDGAYRLALGRVPAEEERASLLAFLTKQTETLRPRLGTSNPPPTPADAPRDIDPAQAAAVVDLCHVLLNLNEFLYVD
jgi:hypothetical protein